MYSYPPDIPHEDLRLIDIAMQTPPSMWMTVNDLIRQAKSLAACQTLLRIRRTLCHLDSEFFC